MSKDIKLTELLFESNTDSGADLEEMAIQNFKTVGDWSKRSSFSHPVDRNLLTSPKAVKKIIYPISALNKEGLKELVDAVAEKL